MGSLALALLLGCVASDARADALPPRECPHTVPTDGARCEPPGYAACTYTDHGRTRFCSCRDGHWACEDMPPAHS